MGQENLDEFAAALEGGTTLSDFLEPRREEFVKSDPDAMREVLLTLLSEVDQRAFTGDVARFIAASTAHALAPGIWGWFDDDIELARPWGFELASIEVPVAIWHGREDRFVPFAHGEWLADHVRGATAHLFDDEGHISIGDAKFGEILDQLVDAARDPVG
jgi:pimeloyl-ACP methyl ester carboxylesterase